MIRSPKKRALIQASLAALLLAGISLGTVTPARGQSVMDVFEALKDAVEKSKDRTGKRSAERRGDQRVKRLQAGLLGLGYYEGEPDGIYGTNTDRALQSFLRERGLEGPRPGEVNALNRMVRLVEAEAAKSDETPKTDDSQPGTAEQPDTPKDWIAAHAETRGGCSYFDQALFGAPGLDGSKLRSDDTLLFGKPRLDWNEADFDLLEKAYFAACGARSGSMDFEQEQFRSNTIGPLRDQISQTKTMMAEQEARKVQDRAKLAADAEAIRIMERTVPQIESAITACERNLTPDCSKISNEALATLDRLSQQAGSLKESKDWPTRIYSLESRALDIRALSYEASKSQDTKNSLISNCGHQIAGRKLSDKVFDLPIMWFEPNFTLRHYICYFHHTDTINNVSEYSDGSIAFYVKQIRLDFVPTEVSKETGNIRYGIKKPVGEGGILALVKVQNGIHSEDVNNAEMAIRFMGELVQRYATPQ